MNLDKILNLFNLNETEKEIFKACWDEQMIGATSIAQKAGLSRTSIYDFLSGLLQKGLIIESQKNGVKMFMAQKPEALELMLEDRLKDLNSAKSALVEARAEYYGRKKTLKPRLQIFEGQEELRQMMRDMLLYRDITAYVLWPVEKVIALLGKEFYVEFQSKRAERNIHIKVIWPHRGGGTKKQFDFLSDDGKLKREARIAPKNVDFSLGYAIYANTVRFISSEKENYGFLIESQEMAEMMRRQFEIIWGVSTII